MSSLEDFMRRWRSTLHENGVCIKSLCKLFIFSRRGAIFIAEDFTGLDSGHASKLAYTAGIASLTSWQAA